MYKITLGVDGMMCGMCESHINDTIRKNFNVKKVNSSHTKKQTVIITESDIDEQSLKDAINATGYTAVSFKKENYEKKTGLTGIFRK